MRVVHHHMTSNNRSAIEIETVNYLIRVRQTGISTSTQTPGVSNKFQKPQVS